MFFSIWCILTFSNQAFLDQVMDASKCVPQVACNPPFQVAYHLNSNSFFSDVSTSLSWCIWDFLELLAGIGDLSLIRFCKKAMKKMMVWVHLLTGCSYARSHYPERASALDFTDTCSAI